MDENALKGATEVTGDSGEDQETGNAAQVTSAAVEPDSSTLEMVSATFPDEASASAAFEKLKAAEGNGQIAAVDAALVTHGGGNRLHIKEERDWPGRTGALVGAGIGAILGTIGGPLGVVIGGAAGAAIGAAAAAAADAGIPEARFGEFAANLQPGAAMVIVVVAELWSAATVAILEQAGGQVRTMVLTDELVRKLHLS